MPVEQRGQAIRVMINLVNWQQDEPTGCGGGRQLSMNGTSRVSREAQARICERLGVRFPGARLGPQWQRRRSLDLTHRCRKAYYAMLALLSISGLCAPGFSIREDLTRKVECARRCNARAADFLLCVGDVNQVRFAERPPE